MLIISIGWVRTCLPYIRHELCCQYSLASFRETYSVELNPSLPPFTFFRASSLVQSQTYKCQTSSGLARYLQTFSYRQVPEFTNAMADDHHRCLCASRCIRHSGLGSSFPPLRNELHSVRVWTCTSGTRTSFLTYPWIEFFLRIFPSFYRMLLRQYL